MQMLVVLIPVSLGLGLVGLVAFIWALRNRQYDDPDGDSQRFLSDEWDDHPKP